MSAAGVATRRADAVPQPSSSASILAVTGLSKQFGALRVTDNVGFGLAAGARTALIGPNGAGKTTLVHLISGVLRPDAGSVTLDGREVSAEPAQKRVRAGLVRTFQINSLFDNLSVRETLYLILAQRHGRAFDLWRPAHRHRDLLDRADAIMAQLALTDDRDRRVGEIAYGRQRIVELGIALALQPRVLLLDEPAAGVPSGEMHLLLDAIAALPPEIAILMIEHDMEMVRKFAREVIVLVQGAVLTVGPPDVVMADPEVRRVYLGDSGQRRFRGGARDARAR